MLKFDTVPTIIVGYILMIFFSFLGFFGGMCIAIGELGSLVMAIVVIPIPFIIELIRSIYYYRKYKNTGNKLVYFLRFSVFIFIMAVISGFAYKVIEMNYVENYLESAGNTVEEYRASNNIENLSEDDFRNINLPENITVEIFDDGYSLLYRYGIYRNENGEGLVRVRRN